MKKIGIITARGGSKRIPKKNIRDFLGKPIMAYSIEAALSSNVFDEVMVSTDDHEIAEVALKYGAKIPFKRSEKTSNDTATTTEVIIEVLSEYKKLGKIFESVCCIYPTAPFITPDSLKYGLEALEKQSFSAAFTVVKYSYPVQRSLRVNSKGQLEMLYPEHSKSRSQDLEPVYHDAGQFYWFKTSEIKPSMELLKMNAFPIIIPETSVQDIDTEADWILAEMKYKSLL